MEDITNILEKAIEKEVAERVDNITNPKDTVGDIMLALTRRLSRLKGVIKALNITADVVSVQLIQYEAAYELLADILSEVFTHDLDMDNHPEIKEYISLDDTTGIITLNK